MSASKAQANYKAYMHMWKWASPKVEALKTRHLQHILPGKSNENPNRMNIKKNDTKTKKAKNMMKKTLHTNFIPQKQSEKKWLWSFSCIFIYSLIAWQWGKKPTTACKSNTLQRENKQRKHVSSHPYHMIMYSNAKRSKHTIISREKSANEWRTEVLL